MAGGGRERVWGWLAQSQKQKKETCELSFSICLFACNIFALSLYWLAVLNSALIVTKLAILAQEKKMFRTSDMNCFYFSHISSSMFSITSLIQFILLLGGSVKHRFHFVSLYLSVFLYSVTADFPKGGIACLWCIFSTCLLHFISF